ncbi:L-seryl-tRNA(Sec) selenium transferase [Alicyclobacillus sp.]|uniref:L-seryl-tRNA(Sec) selenium transferase n=1 Tax=Alicyclobacillus sp. TaxID=61169 RepID=UPI0025C4D2E9|nr:L-seryl-tRNA(Sec) selenium transferase [Alicyclobacillus sp.]MCL6515950.1 L-seryl-tRNA(Sec) selenium transferase [Alicyclobacillus sp.]
MTFHRQSALRALPAVHRLLAEPAVREKLADLPSALRVSVLQEALAELRAMWAGDGPAEDVWARETGAEAIAARARRAADRKLSPRLRPVLNLTGTVLHTNLGRAPLPPRAIRAVTAVAAGYSNLEYDLASGARGSRHEHVEARLVALCGAEAALVVNNNAAAVLLVLSALAAGGEAVVSRGQLVEIGGSFRIPDVMAQAGVRLVEVGATNRTHLADYERAITPETRVLVRVHTSNYRLIGFTAQPALGELADLAHRHGLPLYEDLGSGALFDFAARGVGDEPTVSFSLRSGVDVVTFSGDKLLGSAQAGIIAGAARWLEPMRKHPLMRALRPDKLTLAALDATLSLYLDDDLAKAEIPVVRMLTEPYEAVARRCREIANRLSPLLAEVDVRLEEVDVTSRVGGGALPQVELPSRAIRLTSPRMRAGRLFDDLRTVPAVPVVGRIEQDAVILDVRTLLPGQEAQLVDSVAEAAGRWFPGG